MILTEQKIQIRHKSLILYELQDSTGYRWSRTKQQKAIQIKEVKETTYSGKLTKGAKKRLSKAIDLLCQTVRPKSIYNEVTGRQITHRLSFITLTISQKENITARESYDKGFKHFIQWLRRTKKVTTYVWKCEVQKRGQIHYHITTPSFIHYQEIRDKWNNIQRQNDWTNDYFKLKGHHNPNSTDIKEVRKVSNLSAYLIKEFCKTIQNPETEGKIWDCSLNLKKWKYYTITETTDKTEILSDMIDEKKIDAIPTDYCIVLKMKNVSNTEIMDLKELKGYEDYLTMIRTYRQKEPIVNNIKNKSHDKLHNTTPIIPGGKKIKELTKKVLDE